MTTPVVHTEDGWDLYRKASESYKAKNYDEALRLCRESWRAFGDESKPDALRNRYGYCIYQIELKPLTQTEDQEFEDKEPRDFTDRSVRALEAVEAICSMTSQGQYSPYAMSVLALVKILKKNQGRWTDIEAWTARLNPDELSTETFAFIDSEGKQRELASQLEQWYGARVRALLETQKYQECVELAEIYSRSFQTSHYDYDIWIPSWQAKGLMLLGRAPEALSVADALVARKRSIHTLSLQSKAREGAGDPAGAWIAALEALHERVEPKHLLTAVDQLAHLLEVQNNKGDSWRKLIELLLRIRSTEEWRIPGSLQDRAAEAGIADSDLDRVDALKRLLRELQPCWLRAWIEAEPRLIGTVDILREKSCFLKLKNGSSIYCPARALPRNARQGSVVTFWVRPSFDRVKNRFSEQAIHVRLEQLK